MPFLNLRIIRNSRSGSSHRIHGWTEYRQRKPAGDRPRHPVRDTHFKFDGPVVAQLIEAFAEDWLFAAHENLAGEARFPSLDEVGEVVARVILSGPDGDSSEHELPCGFRGR